ncbi:MAG: helix-turn-helix domain-containing protein, partial [Thermoplasmata archaeon]
MKASEEACMINAGHNKICIYPSEEILSIIGKRYTLLILALLSNRKSVKFNEISRNVGMPRPNLLSHRLQELENIGLVRKKVIVSARPISVEYSLSKKGAELRKAILPLLEWIEKNAKAPLIKK